jgi:predicted adenylyl cyclase CyaB
MVEIELKAWIKDRVAIETRLSEFLRADGAVFKDDEYWVVRSDTASLPDSEFRFRIRTQPGDCVVTFKEKTFSGQIEVNKEVEFFIPDIDSFRIFVSKIGARLLYTKSKRGTRWVGDRGLVAEVITLHGIGDFLEIEILREKADASTISNAKKRLYAALERCGVDSSDIEVRPYSQLLGVQ